MPGRTAGFEAAVAQRSHSCGEHHLLVPHKPLPGVISSGYQLVLELAGCLGQLVLVLMCQLHVQPESPRALRATVITVQVLHYPISCSCCQAAQPRQRDRRF